MNLESISLEYYLGLSAILFSLGVIGVLTRRNAIIIFMSIEMMLNAVNLTLVSFSSYLGDSAGQIFVFFVMAVAAAEAAIGLAIVLALFRNKQTVYVDEVNVMKW
ncbi:MAG TPA: NADH-quinone oxidoreductase subunit NuoK [Patescibacteria group bacterium]|nr:NADH-quinone oxidoreductase subunit NuoK [Patescibacteria group bacterium]